jgi:6-pyruvoyltetrahydropterin/6-carboxytetrahydropterin synthase
MIITIRKELPIGHRLMNHDGLCKNLHGHNYVFEVAVIGKIENHTGMVMDYAELKQWLAPLWDKLDHALVLQEGDPFIELLWDKNKWKTKLVVLSDPPTAENFAKFVTGWLKMKTAFDFNTKVLVRETSDTTALVQEEDGYDVIEVAK